MEMGMKFLLLALPVVLIFSAMSASPQKLDGTDHRLKIAKCLRPLAEQFFRLIRCFLQVFRHDVAHGGKIKLHVARSLELLHTEQMTATHAATAN